ncbi:hypothetical protein BGZ96_009263 [Linnemannia gamsii]|uniref:Uncharacterized protein n=1 Tax=Linnemannia gamsii TaxID=64522 RepID=A0ABQ7JX92_9FUNG|nr:hypothetical protein BGZ96_009263 [Linnemannia gamsii]
MSGLLLLGLHKEFMMDANWTERIYFTLPIIILPVVFRSYLNLKSSADGVSGTDSKRVAYLPRLTKSPSEHYVSEFNLDAFLFLSMDASYIYYLRALIGGKKIPVRVYLSSLVSDSKLSAFLASHYTLVDNDNDIIRGGDDIEQQSATTTMSTKIKLVYSFIASVLVINTYLIVTTMYWDYICLQESTFAVLTTVEEYKQMTEYRFPAWGTKYMCNFPSSGHPETLFALATAYVTTTAWSKLPTKNVLSAWIRMWSTTFSNNDNYSDRSGGSLFAIKKIH